MPKDSLYIINLNSGDIKKVARVKNYQIKEDSGDWIAWLHEKPLKEKKKAEEIEGKQEQQVSGKKKKKRKKKNKKNQSAQEAVEKDVKEVKDPRPNLRERNWYFST